MLVVGAGVDASASTGEEDGGVFQEYLTPSEIGLPGLLSVDDVTLVDDLTGDPVPLTGPGVEADGNGGTRVFLPQLPPGTFTVEHPGGERTITVTAFDGTLGPVTSGTGLPWALYLTTGSLLVAGVLLRRRRALSVVVLLGAAGTFGASLLLGGDDRGPLTREWTACEGANAGARDQLSCKVTALIVRLERGEYDEIRAAIAGSTDPSCHEVTHRSSYHLWRTTRDLGRAQRMLIPGCDDGLIHGISESIATFSTDEAFPVLLADFCASASETFARGACFHGGGHAAIWRANGDLDRGYELCEKFPEDTGLAYDVREECKGSAVMEWSERWARERKDGGDTLRPRVDEPMELCLAGPASELFRLGCYLGTNFRTGDAAAAVAWCNEREDFLLQCMEAVGENLPYFETPMTTIALTLERGLNHVSSCAGAREPEGRAACVASAVRVYSVMKFSHEEGGRLCEAVIREDREACADGVAKAEERLANRGITIG